MKCLIKATVVSAFFLLNVALNAQGLNPTRHSNTANNLTIYSIKGEIPRSAGEAVQYYPTSYVDTMIANTLVGLNDQKRAIKDQYKQYSEARYNLEKNEGFFGNFYRSREHFFELYKEDYFVQINPLLHGQLMASNLEEDHYVINSRGFSIRAGLGKRIELNTSLIETQRSFPQYMDNYIDVVSATPGVVFSKRFNSDIFRIDKGYDFNIAQAMLNVKASKFLDVSLGHGKNFIGHGYRSTILSDFAAPYFHLKLNTHIGKFHYQNIFAEINAESNRERSGDNLLTKKYFVNHYLGYSILENLQIGISETVVFSRSNHFELQYLNPIIFYRSVEQSLGSPDNILLGFDAKWDVATKFRLYGQFSFDEFIFKELFVERRGWWGNKWALQLGAIWAEPLGLDNASLRVETNIIRPYTYQHRDSITNFTHANHSLAHPSGANLGEVLLEYKHAINDNWRVQLLGSVILQGLNENDSLNWGSNINQNFNLRPQNFNIDLLQGNQRSRMHVDFNLSRRIWKTAFVDFNLKAVNDSYDQTPSLDLNQLYFGLGLRWNIVREPYIL